MSIFPRTVTAEGGHQKQTIFVKTNSFGTSETHKNFLGSAKKRTMMQEFNQNQKKILKVLPLILKTRFFKYFFKFLLLVTCSFFFQPGAAAKELCFYFDDKGVMNVANSASDVPSKFRSSLRCTKIPESELKSNNHLARPEEIELGGTIRREELNSPLGKISLRWPRSAENLFGRTPVRAMVDAARTVSQVIRTSSFPTYIQKMDLDWNVVFMDENLPENQIPAQLISNCHPGWMTPPANIYIVAERVAAGCGGGRSKVSQADKSLTEVLVHEMAHALEYHMLDKNNPQERMRAEGFATWFEMYAAKYSTFLDQKELTKLTALRAAYSLRSSPDIFAFSGSGEDYARASMYFKVIEDRFGLRGIVSLYETINDEGLDLKSAINKRFSIKPRQLENDLMNFVKKSSL